MDDEMDWLFDFVLQFLESEKFDSTVMDFVDEKCDIFDNEEENKFIYSDIHNEFRDTINALLASNLQELDVSPEMFFDACVKGRNSRDINASVVEKMVAMDDFLTFKKIMVKRNMELQLEAMRTYKSPSKSKKGNEESKMSEEDIDMSNEDIDMTPGEMDDLMRQSLMEMEMLHMEAEMEQLELERVLAMSLSLEEDRISQMQKEVEQLRTFTSSRENSSDCLSSMVSEAKSVREDKQVSPVIEEDASTSAPTTPGPATPKTPAKSSSSSSPTPAPAKETFDFMDSKPLKMKMELKPLPSISKPLPSIGSSSAQKAAAREEVLVASIDLEHKRKEVEVQLRLNREQALERKDQEEVLREKLGSSAQEANRIQEDREKKLREQRDRIVAQKKKEREMKVKREQELEQEMREGSSTADKTKEEKARVLEAIRKKTAKEAKGLSDEQLAEKSQDEEQRRDQMRMALAHRMKMDLLQEGLSSSKKKMPSAGKYADLTETLQQVERTRQENRTGGGGGR